MAEPTTPAEARDVFGGDLTLWHTQPRCVCGDYLAQHEVAPPHPCVFRALGGPGIACHCTAYEKQDPTDAARSKEAHP